MYHFLNGYTARIPGTEVGIQEPQATFSVCFGAPFLVWPPDTYSKMLAQRLEQHNAGCWLINTGWSGGPYGEGERLKLKYTRVMIDSIHSGELEQAGFEEEPYFGLKVPTHCPNGPDQILLPRQTWRDGEAYDEKAKHLAELFRDKFQQYADMAEQAVVASGPS